MTKNISLFLLLVFSTLSFCQQKIQSGEYENGLRIAYDGESKKITGYYENYTGFDENSKTPRFSCIFYIEGTVVGQKAIIKTYFPENKNVRKISRRTNTTLPITSVNRMNILKSIVNLFRYER